MISINVNIFNYCKFNYLCFYYLSIYKIYNTPLELKKSKINNNARILPISAIKILNAGDGYRAIKQTDKTPNKI